MQKGFVLFTSKNFVIFGLSVALILIGNFAYSKSIPREIVVDLPQGMTRDELADVIASRMSWKEGKRNDFSAILREMQWAELNNEILEFITKRLDFNQTEKEYFLEASAKYTGDMDFLSRVYIGGLYNFKSNDSVSSVANSLIEKFREVRRDGKNLDEIFSKNIDNTMLQALGRMIDKDMEILPDVVPLPPKDLKLETVGDITYLRFSTTYFNQGDGPLELVADKKTKGIRSDIERNVYERIYQKDGETRDKLVGSFMWHQPHLHYHFSDFVIYDLEAIAVEGKAPDLSGSRQKRTFCIRDVSRVDMVLESRFEKAKYLICGKEIQGISPGWGDTYLFSYVDQVLDVSDLPMGTYKLTFKVNPDNKFEESDLSNNISSATFRLDVKNKDIAIVEEFPKNLPKVEHVYKEQVFNQ